MKKEDLRILAQISITELLAKLPAGTNTNATQDFFLLFNQQKIWQRAKTKNGLFVIFEMPFEAFQEIKKDYSSIQQIELLDGEWYHYNTIPADNFRITTKDLVNSILKKYNIKIEIIRKSEMLMPAGHTRDKKNWHNHGATWNYETDGESEVISYNDDSTELTKYCCSNASSSNLVRNAGYILEYNSWGNPKVSINEKFYTDESSRKLLLDLITVLKIKGTGKFDDTHNVARKLLRNEFSLQ